MRRTPPRHIGWKQSRLIIGLVLLIILLVAKYLWPLFVYPVPLGFDVGLYRYLFVHHANGFPPFVMAPMDSWAKDHPLGLFFFSTILLKIGVPVSWLIGWMWNVMCVTLIGTLAWVTAKREGKGVGVLVLLVGVLSIPFFDGFALMYWKAIASLFWCILTYRLLERGSFLAIISGILVVVTHHQTGLLFGLVFASWVLLRFITDLRLHPRVAFRRALPFFLIGGMVCLVGLLWYIPIWQQAVMPQLQLLLAGDSAQGGNFPPAIFYLQTEGILLALGAVGFFFSLKKERWTLWQLSVLWSFVFIAGHLLFYRRFFLQFDFFLLPFAALAIHAFWMRFSSRLHRGILVVALLLQAVSTIGVMLLRQPVIPMTDMQAIASLERFLPQDAFILALDNQSAPFLRGWLPYHHVGAPGLFESAWSMQQWRDFIVGNHQKRLDLLKDLPGTVYIYSSTYFHQYYGWIADDFLKDPCFQPTNYPQLFLVTCSR